MIFLQGTLSEQRLFTVVLILRGTIVIRTYGKHENLDICRFLSTIFGPIKYAPRKSRYYGAYYYMNRTSLIRAVALHKKNDT